MATPRVTQALIYAEIVHMRETLQRHSEQDHLNFQELKRALEGTESAPGLKMQVDRLQQASLIKSRHFGYLWSAIVVILGATLKLLFD
jgi:hypothetical protein